MNSKHKRWLGLLGLLLLLGGITAWCWPDANLARARDLQKELFTPAARSLSSEQRQQKWQEFRKVQEKLSPAQREELFSEVRKQKQAEISRYFKMSAQEKTRHLDDVINRMEKMRQAFQAKGGQPQGNRGPGGMGGGFGVAGPSQGSPNQGGDASGQARERRRQNGLDSSSPAQRAQMAQYLRELNARRTQRGLAQGNRGFGPPR